MDKGSSSCKICGNEIKKNVNSCDVCGYRKDIKCETSEDYYYSKNIKSPRVINSLAMLVMWVGLVINLCLGIWLHYEVTYIVFDVIYLLLIFNLNVRTHLNHNASSNVLPVVWLMLNLAGGVAVFIYAYIKPLSFEKEKEIFFDYILTGYVVSFVSMLIYCVLNHISLKKYQRRYIKYFIESNEMECLPSRKVKKIIFEPRKNKARYKAFNATFIMLMLGYIGVMAFSFIFRFMPAVKDIRTDANLKAKEATQYIDYFFYADESNEVMDGVIEGDYKFKDDMVSYLYLKNYLIDTDYSVDDIENMLDDICDDVYAHEDELRVLKSLQITEADEKDIDSYTGFNIYISELSQGKETEELTEDMFKQAVSNMRADIKSGMYNWKIANLKYMSALNINTVDFIYDESGSVKYENLEYDEELLEYKVSIYNLVANEKTTVKRLMAQYDDFCANAHEYKKCEILDDFTYCFPNNMSVDIPKDKKEISEKVRKAYAEGFDYLCYVYELKSDNISDVLDEDKIKEAVTFYKKCYMEVDDWSMDRIDSESVAYDRTDTILDESLYISSYDGEEVSYDEEKLSDDVSLYNELTKKEITTDTLIEEYKDYHLNKKCEKSFEASFSRYYALPYVCAKDYRELEEFCEYMHYGNTVINEDEKKLMELFNDENKNYSREVFESFLGAYFKGDRDKIWHIRYTRQGK